MYVNLLSRQIKRHLKEDTPITPEWKNLLDAINSSYIHYERDHLLGEQSLEISSGELKQLIEEIADKEARIRAILEATSDGLLVINEKQEIELCNQSAATYLGFTNSSELVGRNVSMFKFSMPEKLWEDEFSTPFLTSLSDIFTLQDYNSLYQLSIVHKNGTLFSVELSISELKLRADKKVIICLLRDISLRKQSEKKIRLRHEITRILFKTSSLNESIPGILSALCASLGLDIIFLWLRDSPKGNIKPLFTSHAKIFSCLEEFEKIIFDTTLSQESEENIVKECIYNSQFYIKDNNDPLLENIKNKAGMHSHIIFPIFFKNKLFGLIEVFSQDASFHDDQLIKILQDIGFELGMFLERQEAQQRVNELQKQLLEAAKQAGMMQVATSVIHNVGNILNSVNISANVIQESIFSSDLEKFIKVTKLIKEQKDNFVDFITNDERGKLLPDYFFALGDMIKTEQKKLQNEIRQLVSKINEIKRVIKEQQSLGVVLGYKEKFLIHELLEDILVMKSKQLNNYEIQIITDYKVFLYLEVDRSKLFQILENLIGNAIDALKKNNDQRKLTIQIDSENEHSVNIRVIDNGCGIKDTDMEAIFHFGFTTKGAEGHGFGLYSCAHLAKEIGGELTVASEGVGKGAVFTLKVPLEESNILGAAALKDNSLATL